MSEPNNNWKKKFIEFEKVFEILKKRVMTFPTISGTDIDNDWEREGSKLKEIKDRMDRITEKDPYNEKGELEVGCSNCLKEMDLYFESFLDDVSCESIAKIFGITFQLIVDVLQSFFIYQGEMHANSFGPKELLSLALNRGLIDNGEIWISMIEVRKSCNSIDFINNFKKITCKIRFAYYPYISQFHDKFKELANSNLY